MIEKNYRIYCAMNNIPVEEGLVEGAEEAEDDDGMAVDDDNVGPTGNDDDEWGGIMEVDDGDDDTPEFFKEQKTAQPFKTPSRRKKTKLGEIIKEKVRKVLEDDTELADQRASKCDENDFLRLLFAFNQEGIHFA
jgi:18S rRNA (adenine1779-N6/adenine1780-N6)-dimethyltransferase